MESGCGFGIKVSGLVSGLGFRLLIDGKFLDPPSIYPLFDPKCTLFGTIYPYLRVQGGSWLKRFSHWDSIVLGFN